MKLVRNHFTLVETLIALTLLSLLLSMIFGFFRELTWWDQQNAIQEKFDFQMRHLESRLQSLFSHTVHEADSTRKFYFYTSPPDENSKSASIVFTFDNGVHVNPYFSGDVLGRLYVDTHKRLCLVIWPLLSDNPHQTVLNEVLVENVEGLSFKFYSPPLPGKRPAPVDPQKKNPEPEKWYEDEWLLSFSQLPAIVQIHLEIEKNLSDTVKEPKRIEPPLVKWTSAFVLPTKYHPLTLPM